MTRSILAVILISSALTASAFVAAPTAAREVGARFGIAAASTTTVPVQLRLTGAGGAPLSGLKTLTFKLYNVPSGGSALWTESWTAGNAVQVTDGVASALLGSITPLSQSLVVNNGTLYLGVAVEAEAEMTPRVQLGSAPYALYAQDIPTAAKTASGGSRILASRTCSDNCGSQAQASLGVGWHPVMGTSPSDPMNVVFTTTGRVLLMTYAFRMAMSPAAPPQCGIQVLQSASQVRFYHLSGMEVASTDWICSGSALVDDLPAGVYTAQLMGHLNATSSVTWIHQRQIVVIEY